MNKRNFTILLIAAFLVRLPMLFDRLWYDENFTLLLARLSFDRMIAATAGDVHPPLWYIITWIFGHWGGPAWLIRIPALVCSLAALVVFRSVLQHMFVSKKAQPFALLLMAFAPLQLHYGTEARMYMLMCLLVLVGIWAIQCNRWLLTSLTVTALLYTHNWGLFYAATLFLFALATLQRQMAVYQRIKNAATILPVYADMMTEYLRMAPIMVFCTFAAAFIAWLPWAFVLRGQMSIINQSYWITRVTIGQVIYQIYQQLWAVSLPNPLGFIVTGAWFFMGVYALRKSRRAFWLLACGPLVMAIIVSLMWQPVLVFRAFIGMSPFFYVILAAPFEWIWQKLDPAGRIRWIDKRRALVAAILILPLFVLAYPNLYDPNMRGNNAIQIADYIHDHRQPGDMLVVAGDGGYINLRALGESPIMLPECQQSLGSISTVTRAAMSYTLRPWKDIHAKRIWFYGGVTPLLHQCTADEFHAITGSTPPALLTDDDEMLYTGLWLVTP